jgi:hypothetical protein
MHWSDIDFRPSSKKLRQFAGLWLMFFGGFACQQAFLRGNATAAIVLGVLAVVVGGLGLALPAAVRPIYVAWMVLAFPIGWVVSRVILAVMFYGIFTPFALVFRLAGRDALGLARRAAVDTYWTPKPMPADVRRYFRQF